ncbi:MAG: hypothetical protein H0U53_07035 [Actinobacteria bacterium]|nr:hypothetical protein [Actinomycetota bacterium]
MPFEYRGFGRGIGKDFIVALSAADSVGLLLIKFLLKRWRKGGAWYMSPKFRESVAKEIGIHATAKIMKLNKNFPLPLQFFNQWGWFRK